MNNRQLAMQLREFADNNGYSHNDYADTMRQAADVLDKHTKVLYSVLQDVAQTLAWQAHGECRGFSDTLLSVNAALEAAKAALSN